MNILVRRCASFISCHLINHLIKYNHTIYEWDNLSSKSYKTQKKNILNLKKVKKLILKRLN